MLKALGELLETAFKMLLNNMIDRQQIRERFAYSKAILLLSKRYHKPISPLSKVPRHDDRTNWKVQLVCCLWTSLAHRRVHRPLEICGERRDLPFSSLDYPTNPAQFGF
ncbi:unnamed protein product [Toxocara canis]|uniref:Uncharacterized protein n=1 Tax=Toxocara canis TaxID=6265 RepID=A0A183V986_TOXCA|nr:unnamed protein product [Toxocara canis]